MLSKKKNRGFTLIELLAVIIILAIIAVIAVPLVRQAMASAKKGALKDSAYALISSADYYLTNKDLTSGNLKFNISGGLQ